MSVGQIDVPARRGSLLRAELHRFRSRRAVLVLLLLALAGLALAVGTVGTQYAKPSAAGLARAEQARQESFRQAQAYTAECRASAGTPQGVPDAEFCGPELQSIDEYGSADAFLDKRPFTLDGEGRNGLLVVIGGAAMIAFLWGATYVGAEWSSRSMLALLFWEPRRLRVMGSKIAVTALAGAALGLLAVAGWLLAARALAGLRGTLAVPDGTWGELYGSAGRGVLLVALAAMVGFGLANLLRGTAAAFGVAFVYVVVLENLVRVFRPRWRSGLLTENIGALISEGGQRLYSYDETIGPQGLSSSERVVVLSNLHGGLVLGAVTAAVVAVGVVLFARRDLA